MFKTNKIVVEAYKIKVKCVPEPYIETVKCQLDCPIKSRKYLKFAIESNYN